ncbi:MAG: type I DNA topoisomerase [Deltaproteobacteria bacterium]|nr:type I DNA topoisomerase [Deltaproteobacteria bacterium]
MPHSLIIVESPTKVKTIKKYVGNDFDVRASMGHVKDLPKSSLGIDLKNDFAPSYSTLDSRKKVMAELKKAAKNAENIYLAPDPDREGEAIAWHIADEIGREKQQIHRVLFNDLTKNTILEAIAHPSELNVNKYEAQQTRRILDRLVGYQISPILWEKVKRGLSAGRVQSVAVRMICDRENQIRKFIPEEYWNITAKLEGKNPPPFEAKLIIKQGKKLKVQNQEQAQAILEILKTSPFKVEDVEKKETKRSPSPPFTTSKLQQEASRQLRFPAKKTMRVAQQLYEGVELGDEGSVGLITYMRTDSVRTAAEALNEVRNFIRNNYEPEYLPPNARAFKVKGSAQDAHEAIRPTSMDYRPQDIKSFLTADQYRLYQLIWNRFVASQMNPAVFDQTTINVSSDVYLFRAQGSVMKFAGYTAVYTEGKDETDENNDFARTLPEVLVGEILKLLSLDHEQKFTQPPPRFSEASLVRELEEKGIGRPSTYATILSTIQDRSYVKLEKGRFFPTELGTLVNDLLVLNFPQILDIEFTALLENQLDLIEEGKLKRLATLEDFYAPFEVELKKAQTGMENVKKNGTPTDIVCNKCGSPMVIKLGRNGEFLSCSNYPSCKNTQNFSRNAEGKIVPVENQTVETEHICEKCGKPMVLKRGRFGPFLGCSGYPDCKNILNIKQDENGDIKPVEQEFSDVKCDKCGKPMVLKHGRYGPFLGCSGYPDCQNIMKIKKDRDGKIKAEAPQTTDEVCDKCGRPMAVKRGRYGSFLGCTGYPECKNIRKLKANS